MVIPSLELRGLEEFGMAAGELEVALQSTVATAMARAQATDYINMDTYGRKRRCTLRKEWRPGR